MSNYHESPSKKQNAFDHVNVGGNFTIGNLTQIINLVNSGIPESEEVNNLLSERGINYTRLQALLAAGIWKEADRETELVMIKAAVQDKETCLATEDIRSFSCRDLHTIDALWLKHSNDRFGFSVQKQIWQEAKENSLAFGDRIGWRKQGKWIADYHSEFDFSLDAPVGHLPCFARACEGWYWGEHKWKDYGNLGELLELGLGWGFSVTSFLSSDLGWESLERVRQSVISSLMSRMVEYKH